MSFYKTLKCFCKKILCINPLSDSLLCMFMFQVLRIYSVYVCVFLICFSNFFMEKKDTIKPKPSTIFFST